MSFVFDQFYWGERIAESSVGPKPIRHTNLTVERLTEAIRLGVSNSQMRQKAAELGQTIRAEKGVENALQVIEKILAKRDPYELSQT